MSRYIRNYISLSLSSLGAARICLGIILLDYWLVRLLTAREYLSNEGFLPNHFNIFVRSIPGWSLLNAFSTPYEVTIVMLGIGSIFLLFTLGIGGIWVRIGAFAGAISILNRNLSVENGGHVVMNLILLWMIWMPVAERFSWAGYRRVQGVRAWIADGFRPGVYTGIGGVGIILSLAFIYTFNYLSKTGITWQSGTAIHYTLWMSARAYTFAYWVRANLSPEYLYLISKFVISIEGILPFLILSPVFTTSCRRAAALLIVILHTGIALFINIGPFSYVMFVLAIMIFPSFNEGMETAHDGAPRYRRLSTMLIGTFAGIILIFVQATQSLYAYQNWMKSPITYLPPQWTTRVVEYVRIPQNWRMFSTDAPPDSRVVIRTGTIDGHMHDLDSGKEIFIGDNASFEPYFTTPLGRDHLRIESDTRISFISATHQAWFMIFLRKQYPGYDTYKVIELRRNSPPFGMQTYQDPISVRELF